MTFSPISLFVYNRPWHTRQTVEALLANEEAKDTDMYVFSDSAKNESVSKAVSEVRSYIHGIAGFRSVNIIEREVNFGLAKSIIEGVSQVCEQHGRVIVLEDDMVTSPYFLRYMNDGLTRYEQDERVISVTGYMYPVRATLPETFFLIGADCWGWGTWKRGWDQFEADGEKLLQELTRKRLSWKFDYDGSYPHMRMLKNQIKGKNDSWAIRWHASACSKGLLTLCAGQSLVQNIGFDDSGTHCGSGAEFCVELASLPIEVREIANREDDGARRKIVRFLYLVRLKSMINKFFSVFIKIIRRIRGA